jgi:ion channel-forming bestrophin family protein
MIIRPSFKTNIEHLFQYLWFETLFSVLYSSLIYYLYERHDLAFLGSFDFVPISFFGAIMSVFLAFRNNNAYSRWWEARQLWGDLINASRMFATQVFTYFPSHAGDNSQLAKTQKVLVHRQIAFAHALRLHLRKDMRLERIDRYLLPEDMDVLKQSPNPASTILALQSATLQNLTERDIISDYRFVSMNENIQRFYDILGACERIKNTPFPKEVDGFVRSLVWILMFVLPIYLLGVFSDDLSKLLIIPLTMGISIIIGFANKAGEIMEDPFENRIHDVPMSALCNTIEIDLMSQLGDSNIPDKHQEKHGIVW